MLFAALGRKVGLPVVGLLSINPTVEICRAGDTIPVPLHPPQPRQGPCSLEAHFALLIFSGSTETSP